MNEDQFVLLATVPIKPGCEDEYLALVNDVNDKMRREPTFVNTVLHRSTDDPGLFMLHETWRDQADFFSVQMKRPYRARYEARLPDLLRGPREMKVFVPLRADYAAPTPQAGGSPSEPDEGDSDTGPIAVLKRFYEAEGAYMSAGGDGGGASFDALAATLDPNVVLHQSPDLPWGGEFHGHAGYEDWARRMSGAFDQLGVKDRQLFAVGDIVVAVCRLVTRSRSNGKVLDAPMAQVVTVKGDRIVEFRPFYWNVPDYQKAVEADHD